MTSMRIAVVVATVGRPEDTGRLLQRLGRQSLRPARIILSVAQPADLPPAPPTDVEVIIGSKGLTAQRNRGLDALAGDCDIVAFFDDDYLPSDTALAGMAALFQQYDQVVGATGVLLADGVKVGGVPLAKALDLLNDFDARPDGPPRVLGRLDGLYGCNMAFRHAAIGQTRFDEALPLYGWQEDVDFAARLKTRGWLVKTDAFVGVHRGVPGARSSGLRLGYSQIVNPAYLARKGTMAVAYAFKIASRNVLANHVRTLAPEPGVDRWGRARGNWLGLWHLATGRADPRHILNLS